MKATTSRQRVQQLLAFEEPDRIALTDAYWEDTLARWRQEGLPPSVNPSDYFGFDFDWLFMDASLRLPEELLEDTDEYTVRRDKHGFVAKQWKGRAGRTRLSGTVGQWPRRLGTPARQADRGRGRS